MEEYSIQQISDLLGISKDTLRYYDKISLVCPKRGENNYRYYTQEDMLDLQYVEVLKTIDFPLAEIRQIFGYRRAKAAETFHEILRILNEKRAFLERKEMAYGAMIEFVDKTKDVMEHKKSLADITKIDILVTDLFHDLKGERQ